MGTLEILIKIFPMLIAILIGYILTIGGILKKPMIDSFKKIIMFITLPASVFSAFIKIKFEISYLLIIFCMLAANLLILLIAKLLAKAFSIKSKYFPFLIAGFETGMVGYPIYIAVYGTNAAANLGILDIGHAIFIFFLYIPLMISVDRGENKGLGFKESLGTAFRNPPFWAITIGFICAVIGISAYADTLAFKAADSVLQFVGAPTSLLICLILGNGLKLSFKGIRISVITALIKLLVSLTMAVALYFAVFKNIADNPLIVATLFIFFVMPAPFIIPIFMHNTNKEDISYVSNTLSIGSVFSVVAFVAIVLINGL